MEPTPLSPGDTRNPDGPLAGFTDAGGFPDTATAGEAVRRLAALVAIPTVSSTDPSAEDPLPFSRFPDVLRETYPAAHAAMAVERIGERGLVYRWDGTDASLPPFLGLAHWDVVPVGDRGDWSHDPFSATAVDGRLYGRGTLDDKGMLAGWFEAIERMIGAGRRPARTCYFAFGGDEECTGVRGAAEMARAFAERGVRFSMVLDEGGAVAEDQLAGFASSPVALIGTVEKGYLTLRLRAGSHAGHAASPPQHTAVGRLASALAYLESHPFPTRLTATPVGMLKALGRAGTGAKSLLMRAPRVFSPLLRTVLAKGPETAAIIRTTLAPTVIHAGERDNVLPKEAEALVNLRLLPGDDVAGATDRVGAICRRFGVETTIVEGHASEPVGESPTDGGPWKAVVDAVSETWPHAVVSPHMMTGTTDSRWYRHLSRSIFRFVPLLVSSEEMRRVHGPDESIRIAEWGRTIRFLDRLLSTLGYRDVEDPGER